MNRGLVIGLVAGVAVLAAAGTAAWVLTRPAGPEAAAEAYLDALAHGDFDAIEKVTTPSSADQATLREAFTGASAYIADVSYDLEGDTGDLASVTADVTLGGDAGVIRFLLDDVDGQWMVTDDHLASLEATTTIGTSVRVGDATVPAGTPIALLPAVYPVTASPPGILEGGTEIAVTGESPAQVEVAASVAPSAASAAQLQLDAYANACAEPSTTVPARCGIRVPWAADLTSLSSIAFRIEQLPAVALADDARTFAATGGVLVATATGTPRESAAAASFTYRTDNWALRGNIEFIGDEMVLSVR